MTTSEVASATAARLGWSTVADPKRLARSIFQLEIEPVGLDLDLAEQWRVPERPVLRRNQVPGLAIGLEHVVLPGGAALDERPDLRAVGRPGLDRDSITA